MTPPKSSTTAVVPVYNHEHAVANVVDGLLAAGLPCLLVDDGSGPECAASLDRIVATHPRVTLMRRTRNGGKGAAVSDGLRSALKTGYTHAIQVDADGQHSLDDVSTFLDATARYPDALICGQPIFDASMPKTRFLFRYLTHVFVWLNTLSLDVRDSMCGFRVYPLAATVAMLDSERPGARMDFDIEVLVRLHWRQIRMVWIPTKVRYPQDGISHFRLLHDNALITWLHARLFLGMLIRFPNLLKHRLRRLRDARHAS